MNRLTCIALSTLFSSTVLSQIVVPEWEDTLTHGISASIESAVGDNYGTHVLVRAGGLWVYHLLGNDGALVSGTTTPVIQFVQDQFSASITSHAGVVSILAVGITPSLRVHVFQSADGGKS